MAVRRVDLLLIAAILWAWTLLTVLATPPVQGYEVSLYRSIPWTFWAGLIGGMLVAVYSLGREWHSSRSTGAAEVALLSAFWFVLFTLPALHGYVWWGRHDPMTHVGFTIDIERSSHIGSADFYPGTHIYTLALAGATQDSLIHSAQLLPAIFAILFSLGVCLLTREVVNDDRAAAAVFPFSTIPFFGWNELEFAPKIIGFYLLPIILFLFFRYYRTRQTRVMYALLLGLGVLPFVHPGETTPVLVAMVALIAVAYRVTGGLSRAEWTRTLRVIAIPLIATFLWFSSFVVFDRDLARLANNFFGVGTEAYNRQSVIEVLSARKASAGLTLLSIADQAARHYLAAGVVLTLALLGAVFCFRQKDKKLERAAIACASAFAASVIAFPPTLFFDVIVADLTELRQLKYVVLLGLPLCGIAIAWFLNRSPAWHKRHSAAAATFVVVWALAATPAVFALYPDPFTATYNQQLTRGELLGASWWLDHKDGQALTDEVFFLQIRQAHFLIGYEATSGRRDVRGYGDIFPPSHFSYNNSTSLRTSYNQPHYVVWNKVAEAFYWQTFPDHARYSPEEYRRLGDDHAVARIYDSGEMTTYYVQTPRHIIGQPT